MLTKRILKIIEVSTMMTRFITSPRGLMTELIYTGNFLSFALLVVVAGSIKALFSRGFVDSLATTPLSSTLGTILSALLFWLCVSVLVHAGARILGGTGSFAETLAGVSFAQTPWLIGLFALPLVYVISFYPDGPAFRAAASLVDFVRLVLKAMVFVMLVYSISKTHRFMKVRPTLMAMGSIAMAPLLLLAAVMFVIALLLWPILWISISV